MKVATESRARALWQRLLHTFHDVGPNGVWPAGNGAAPQEPASAGQAPPPFDREKVERNIEARLRERLDQRLDQFSERLGKSLGEQLERELPGRVAERLQLNRGNEEGTPGERSQLAQALQLLEERILALQEELRGEQREQHNLAAELAAERERHQLELQRERGRIEQLERAREAERGWAQQAEGERNQAREDLHAYRRVLAAAIANEKYSIDVAARERREALARRQAQLESEHARGIAEGKSLAFSQRLSELTRARPLEPKGILRATAMLAAALIFTLVGLAQWIAAVVAWSAPEAAPIAPPLALAFGTGAIGLAACLFLAYRREVAELALRHNR